VTEPSLELAASVAARLAAIDGVVAVGLGGSWARGDADVESDVDLGVYYRAARRPRLAALRRLAEELDVSRPLTVTDFGEWGPWIDGGAWLRIGGRRVDWLYRDVGRVAAAIEESRTGRSRCHYQVGHPHGFHTHYYLAETFFCRPLEDPEGALSALKVAAVPYPPRLRRQLVDDFLFEAGFALDTSRKSAARGDVLHVAGNLFRAAAALVQVLCAVNERYLMNEKAALRTVDSLPRRPPGFSPTIGAVLGRPGESPAELLASIERLAAVVAEVRELSAREGA
jgi:predicted nucleotidyltransferase